MRPIKFRAWDKERKQMWHFDLQTASGGKSGYGWTDTEEKTLIDLQDDKEIMQFTGLLDKSGKEIYEGDILKGISKTTGQDVIREVKWQDDGAAFYTDLIYGSWPAVMIGEIIGNIYENPSVLEGEAA